MTHRNFLPTSLVLCGLSGLISSHAFADEPTVPTSVCVPVAWEDDAEIERDYAFPIVRCIVSDRSGNQNNERVQYVVSSHHRDGRVPEELADIDYSELPDGDTLSPWFDNDALDYPFGLQSLKGMREVERFVGFYTTQARGRIHSYFSRAGKYQDIILAELERQGAPRDLLWVVAIESNFEPVIHSSAGAAGLWQFMPRTAVSRGMTVGGGVDERLDPTIATREGVSYLLYQLERFGSWPLALAAYNAGSGHVRGQIRAHGVTELDAMERYGSVYQGARSYAAKIIAIALIDRNRAHFGFDAVVPEAPWVWDEVRIDEPVRLSLIADAAGVRAEEVIELNPALTGRAVPREGWTVRIPKGTFETFVRSYDRVADRWGKEHTSVVLRFGETPNMIAQRFDIPERVLRAVNGFSSGDTIPYGSELVVPESSRRSRGSTTSSASSSEKPTIVVPEQRYQYPNRQRVFYEVHLHDTLQDIADFFEVSRFELAAWNELDPRSTIWDGMTLQIFVAKDFELERAVVLREEESHVVVVGSPEWAAWRRAQEEESRASSSRARRRHVVRPGDTVLRIANRYGVEARDIVRWNNLRDSGHIVIGQELLVSPGR